MFREGLRCSTSNWPLTGVSHRRVDSCRFCLRRELSTGWDGLLCNKNDFQYISGGLESNGDFTLDLEPGSYRFVSAGKEGADLDDRWSQ